jgi:hypothetical protein
VKLALGSSDEAQESMESKANTKVFEKKEFELSFQ